MLFKIAASLYFNFALNYSFAGERLVGHQRTGQRDGDDQEGIRSEEGTRPSFDLERFRRERRGQDQETEGRRQICSGSPQMLQSTSFTNQFWHRNGVHYNNY